MKENGPDRSQSHKCRKKKLSGRAIAWPLRLRLNRGGFYCSRDGQQHVSEL